jgi:hypothetical protein
MVGSGARVAVSNGMAATARVAVGVLRRTVGKADVFGACLVAVKIRGVGVSEGVELMVLAIGVNVGRLVTLTG